MPFLKPTEPRPLVGCTNAETDRMERDLALVAEAMQESVEEDIFAALAEAEIMEKYDRREVQ
jgi:hypothetical protein